jgi:hypothetical protein
MIVMLDKYIVFKTRFGPQSNREQYGKIVDWQLSASGETKIIEVETIGGSERSERQTVFEDEVCRYASKIELLLLFLEI